MRGKDGSPPHWSIYSVTLEFDTTTRKWPSSSAAASGVLVRHHRKWCWRDLYLLIVWWTDKLWSDPVLLWCMVAVIMSHSIPALLFYPLTPTFAIFVLFFVYHLWWIKDVHIGTAIIYKTSCALPDRVKPLLFSTSGHSDAQSWASECPDVKNRNDGLTRIAVIIQWVPKGQNSPVTAYNNCTETANRLSFDLSPKSFWPKILQLNNSEWNQTGFHRIAIHKRVYKAECGRSSYNQMPAVTGK